MIGLGFGLSLGVAGRGGKKYDPLATTLFARMSVQPDQTRKTLINSRIIAGKAKSFWAKLDALWVHAAHDAQAGRLNWLTGNYDCVPINNPTFTTDRGYMGDGSGSYLDTGFNPSTATSPNYQQNSGSHGVRSNTDNIGTGSLAGFYDTTNNRGTTINPKVDNTNQQAVYRLNQGSTATSSTVAASPTSIGMFVATLTPTTGGSPAASLTMS